MTDADAPLASAPRIILHNDKTQALAARLAEAHPDAQIAQCNSYSALPALITDFRPHIVYAVRFDGTPGYPSEALLGPDGPAWLANGGVGTDHLGHWDRDRITVTNAAGVAAGMMAEYILGCFLNFTLDLPGLRADQKAHRWRSRYVRPLAGQTLLIIGLGQTGTALAARAKAFGMTVIGSRASPRAMEHVDEVHASDTLADLLPRADFVALCTPLIPATHGLVGAAECAAMKPASVAVRKTCNVKWRVVGGKRENLSEIQLHRNEIIFK